MTTEYHGLEKEEVNIIAGALELSRKTVGHIMTRLEDVFMLSYDAILDFETVSEIMKQGRSSILFMMFNQYGERCDVCILHWLASLLGFSRIPIYEAERSNIIGLLFIKELAMVDPEDATPLKTLCQFYQNECNFVFEDTTLDVIFKEFKEGRKGHMAFVHRVNREGEGDPFYETVGLVTLEDVIEELIQSEIVDETDVWSKLLISDWFSLLIILKFVSPLTVDNRSKRLREKGKLLQDFSSFAAQNREELTNTHKISPQLALATYQFLNSSIEHFKPEYISERVLRRLMQQDSVIGLIRVKNKNNKTCTDKPDNTILYQQVFSFRFFFFL